VRKLKVNGTIFIRGFKPETTDTELQEYFGQLGIIKRQKQKRGYPDQWPFKIKVRGRLHSFSRS
jgi:RNA recognition motif-containing protein